MPLRAWSDAQREAMAAVITDALAGWERAWGLPASREAVQCAPAAAQCESGASQWLGTRDGANAWFERRAPFDGLLAQALWNVPATWAPIARAVQAQCAQDLAARVSNALGLDRTALLDTRAPCAGAWSGALSVTLPWAVEILLEGGAVASSVDSPKPAATRPLVPLQEALAASGMKLRVHLADCEIAVGGLGELQVGDVLRLRHALHAPAQVRDADGHALFDAALVRHGGRKAAQLVTRAPATPFNGKAVP